jgi:phage terminase small subunit
VFAAAQQDIAINGLVVTNRSVRKDGTETTWTTKNPAVAVALAAATQLRQYAALFGLSPADERNLATANPETNDDDDPFAVGKHWTQGPGPRNRGDCPPPGGWSRA